MGLPPQLELLAACLQSQVRTQQHVKTMQPHAKKYEHTQFHSQA